MSTSILPPPIPLHLSPPLSHHPSNLNLHPGPSGSSSRMEQTVDSSLTPLTAPIPPAPQAPDVLAESSPKTSARLREKRARRLSELEPWEDVSHAEGSKGSSLPKEEEKYLQPAEFYPLNNQGVSATRTEVESDGETPSYLSPEDDKLATRGIPIFRPTMEEFQDFEGYVNKTVAWGQYSGIVKIVPPSEWSSTLPPIPSRALANVRIKNPIQQNMLGRSGLFRQTNVEKNKARPLTIKEWFEKSNSSKFAGPGPKDFDPTLDRDSEAAKRAREEAKAGIRRKREEAREKRSAKARRKAEREDQVPSSSQQSGLEEMDQEEAEMNKDQDDDVEMKDRQDSVPPLDPSHQSSHSSPDLLAKTPETDPEMDTVPQWYDAFHPDADWLPKETQMQDYTPEACASLERRFWKNMGLGEPSWYGADLQGTLFPDPKTPWNVAHLPNLLNRLGRELPGVNRPYLYFGMWRAAFAWHVEDMDLFSINYIHFGAPKFWYAIPQGHAEQFERTIGGYFPQEAAECDQFLRHKSYIMSPTRLAKDGVRVNMMVHKQGEFVITFPRGYHAGFNMGFNCAESVNFALESWVELGRRAKVCQCVSHSVRIDMDELLGLQEKRMKTEQELIEAFEQEKAESVRTKRPYKKRGRPSLIDGDGLVDDFPVSGMSEKKPVIPLQKKARVSVVKAPTHFPCVLCPGQDHMDLVPVYEPSDHIKSMGKSVDSVIRAHRACVNSTPEVWVEDREVDGQSQTYVFGVEGIQKDRWNLKCQGCKDKKLATTGAKIQCVNGKCPKAFHVTCARDDDQVVYRVWEVEEAVPLPIPEDAPEGTQHEFVKRKTLKTEILCPNHNPEVKEAKKRAQAEELKMKILAFIPGQNIKVRTSGGLFEVRFVQAHEGERTADVQHQNGEIRRVKFTEFDFRPGPIPLAENEYARHHTHTRRPTDEDPTARPKPLTSAPLRWAQPITGDPAAHKQQRRPAQPWASAPVQTGQAPRPVLNGHLLPPPHRQPLVHPPNGLPLPQHPPNGQRHIVHPQPQSSSSTTGLSRFAGPSSHSPLSVQQMLNQPMNHYDPRQIPSRVVVCDSDYRMPSLPLGYGYSVSSKSNPHGPAPYASQNGSYSQHQVKGWSPSHSQGVLPQHPPPQAAPPAYPLSSTSAVQLSGPAPANRPSSSPFAFAPPPLKHYSMPQPPTTTPYRSLPVPNGAGPVIAQRQFHSAPSAASPALVNSGKIELGLERMRRLMAKLPPIQTPAIHLAGTNGKGSVSAMLESCLRSAGLTVARYNSPHLVEARRAIAINGRPPSIESYRAVVERVAAVNRDNNISATSFELATATAYVVIGESRPDVMIIECGMGGETDATNVIPPHLVLASGLTAVGLDHTEFLGDTVEKITQVKAGITVPQGILVVAPQRFAEVIPVAQRVVEERGAKLVRALRSETTNPGSRIKVSLDNFTTPPLNPIRIGLNGSVFEARLSLPGAHQLDNASLALNILTTIRSDSRALQIQPKLSALSDDSLRQGLANAEWAGRCSWVQYPPKGHPILVDGAHNADSAKTLRAYLDTLDTGSSRTTWIISLSDSKGKSPQSVLEPLLRKGDLVILTRFETPVEGMPWIKPVQPGLMLELAGQLVGDQGSVRIVPGVMEALDAATGESERGLVVLGGSLYLVSDLYKLIEGGAQ